MTKLILLISLCFILAGPADQLSGKVVAVPDGNTIEILNEDKETVKIMLSNVDCPEQGQEYADEARAFTEKMVLKKKVVIQLAGKDRWGNKLGVVLLNNGKNLGHELVKAGLAWVKKDAEEALNNMQTEAKSGKIGLWTNDNPTPPWVYRRQQTMMAPKGR